MDLALEEPAVVKTPSEISSRCKFGYSSLVVSAATSHGQDRVLPAQQKPGADYSVEMEKSVDSE